ncbi:hypothetical protein Mpt1_c10080 [Candidatus Methanoplasma termitum]|uniref:Thoeris protein ThsB TIR-like domain-containing protein n=1 Tax=Candidatus Methanoplasma termitum TaxID=1577791 RepID=A0A0A7LH82_9ARCH|nr:TIR domain-containing protein [Candidatus Methanoplasma termitum]AIZ56881.1 hypothetical protein Mpt1_c10080 [Candidatus Methanoplasma termitum]
MAKRAFISFDYDHDLEIKEALVGQAKLPDSPFSIVDVSIKEAIDTNWKEYARKKIKSCDVVVVLCGKHTNGAKGVTAEISIAQEENVPYFLLKGHKNESVRPVGARNSDKMYDWTWDNLKALFAGRR